MASLSIIHVDTGRDWRGGQQSLLTLARALRERDHRQVIVSPGRSQLTARAKNEGFTTIEGCPRGGDIIHSHSGRAHNIAFRNTIFSGVKRVVTRHVAFSPSSPWAHRLKYTWTCHGIIAVSGAVRDVLLASGIPARKIEVIYSGVPTPTFLPTVEERIQARRRFGLESGHFVVAHMGAFTGEKGQRTAIDAARLLPEVVPEAHLILAGDGRLQPQLKAEAPPNVAFPGFLQDNRVLFAAADLFIMPSQSEAWGLAAIEAMAHGVPVAASNVGGLAEIVEPGVSGWLVEPGEPRALVEAIQAAASDRARLATMSLAARNRALRFSITNMAEMTERFYRRLLKRK